MIVVYLAPLVAAVGALLYGFAGNAKAQELGRIAFFAGLLATLLIFSHARV
jgi:Na+/phosphate symporter